MSHSITRVSFRNQRDYHCAYFPEELINNNYCQIVRVSWTITTLLCSSDLLYYGSSIAFGTTSVWNECKQVFFCKIRVKLMSLQVGSKLSRRLITFEWFPLAIFEHLDDIVLWRKPYSYDWGQQTQNAKPTPPGSFESHLDIQREPVQ